MTEPAMTEPAMTEPAMTTRKAVGTDGPALQLIDHQTWSPQVTPAPAFSAEGDFFAHNALDDVIVAVATTAGRPGQRRSRHRGSCRRHDYHHQPGGRSHYPVTGRRHDYYQ